MSPPSRAARRRLAIGISIAAQRAQARKNRAGDDGEDLAIAAAAAELANNDVATSTSTATMAGGLAGEQGPLLGEKCLEQAKEQAREEKTSTRASKHVDSTTRVVDSFLHADALRYGTQKETERQVNKARARDASWAR